MPSPKSSNRRGGPQPEEKNRRGKLTEKASSFHYARLNLTDATSSSSSPPSQSFPQLRRPKTLPDLIPNRGILFETTSFLAERQQAMKLTKILMNVTVQGSVGAVQVLISPDSTVGDLITAVLSQYAKEARRPILLPKADPSKFNLHYSQFTLECLDREEKLMELGSRNFFLCQTNIVTENVGTTSSCATQADKIVAKSAAFGWLKFMESML